MRLFGEPREPEGRLRQVEAGVFVVVRECVQEPERFVGGQVPSLIRLYPDDDVSGLGAEAPDLVGTAPSAPLSRGFLPEELSLVVEDREARPVGRGADKGETFKGYVDHLAKTGVVTAEMAEWVNEIRELGNDANHDLIDIDRAEAEELLTFVAMLLKVIYEYPAKGRRSIATRAARDAEDGGSRQSSAP